MHMKSFFASLMLIVVAAVSPAQALHVLYGGGDHPMIPGQQYVGQPGIGLTGLGHTATTFNAFSSGDWTAALSGGLGSFDAIVVGQRENFQGSLTAGNIAAINSYVAGGGNFILAGNFSAANILNTIFGYSVGGQAYLTTTITGATAGTTYAGGPFTLPALSSTHAVLNAPGSIMYANGGYAGVFVDQIGAGTVTYLGWDYCCAGTLADHQAWYQVLNSALNYSATPVPAPGALALLGLGLFGFGAVRRRA